MDKKELLELIEEKIDDVFLEYQKKNDIKSGTILEMACSCWPEVAMSRSKKAMPAA